MIISKLNSVLKEKNIRKTPFAKETGIPRTFIESLLNNDFKNLDVDSVNNLIVELDLTSLSDLLVYIPYTVKVENLVKVEESDEVTTYEVDVMCIDENKFTAENKKFTLTALVKEGQGSLTRVDDLYEWTSFFAHYDIAFFNFTVNSVIDYVKTELTIKSKRAFFVSNELNRVLQVIGK